MTDTDQSPRCESLSWTDKIRCIHPAGHPGDHTNQLATDINQIMWIDNPTPEPKRETSSPRQQDAAAEHRLRLAHAARRAKEHQLDDIRRALCDIGFMEDDDPYSHADLADVIRQVGQTLPTDEPARTTPDNPATSGDAPDNSLREQLDEARQWARHGYEIGQRHCSWSDHGVAPAWLTEGWPPHFDSCEHLARAAEYDEALARVRALAEQWQAAMRPGEKHPAAQQIHAALGQAAPKETV